MATNALRIHLTLAAAAAVTGSLGCGLAPGESPVEERDAPIIAGTPVANDPIGNAFVKDGFSSCSGVFLSPQWLLTAGHCIADDDNTGYYMPPKALVYPGNSTTNYQTTSEVVIHPRWYNSSLSQPYVKDRAYDIALLKVPTPFGTSLANGLYNMLSNADASVGQSLKCYAYGATATDNTGGGIGKLQTATLPVVGTAAQPQGASIPAMLELAPASGQKIWDGDSGGLCTPTTGSPYVISGIIDAKNNISGDGYLVEPIVVQEWIDQNMYSPPAATELPPATPTFISSTSTTTLNGRADFVVAGIKNPTSGQKALYMKVYSEKTNIWSAWSALSTTGLPAGGPRFQVGMAATSVTPGYPVLVLALVASDGAMYVANLNPAFAPSSAWTSFTWSAAGGNFISGPAIGFLGGRIDYFGLDTSKQIYTRGKSSYLNNNSWTGNWTSIPSSVTMISAPAVSYAAGRYALVAQSSDTTYWVTAVTGVSNSGITGQWAAWGPLDGGFLSGPAIASWKGGLDVFGIGGDGDIWHNSLDWNDHWSGWLSLHKGTFTQRTPDGLSAANLYPNAHQVDIVTTTSGSTPAVIRYPR